MFRLYEGLLALVSLLLLPVYLIVGLVRGKYLSNLPERLGRYRQPGGSHDLWIHAVSVGEALGAKSIVEAIVEQKPDVSLLVTTTTRTGQEIARRHFPAATVTYFPFDFTFAIRRFLSHYRPGVALIVETEIWPSLLAQLEKQEIPVLLANGRISDRSFGRYRAVRFFLKRVLRIFAVILVREERDRQRFIAIGADPSKVDVAGNVKFDWRLEERPLEFSRQLQAMAGRRPIVVFGSTVAGEDELLAPLIERLGRNGDAFIVVAPRKPERFDAVATILGRLDVRTVRRSRLAAGEEPAADVLLLDTIGELARIYGEAAAAFVGGSLIPGTGGHNPIEPAAAGAPLAFGRHMSNFQEIARTFLEREGAIEVADVEQLGRFLATMIGDSEQRQRAAERARAVVDSNRGAARRVAAAVARHLR
jgi:3-deoxy-D-manno-octulosonic-acid transferase